MLNIIPKPVALSNYRIGRDGKKPIAIVIHISTSTADSCDAWFANPESKVSAHYLVRRDGVLHKYVDESSTAYHAGLVSHPTCIPALRKNPNPLTLGIEHEGKITDEPTGEQYASSAELIADLALRWDIPIDADHVIRHNSIRHNKDCPAKVDVARLIQIARARHSGFSETELRQMHNWAGVVRATTGEDTGALQVKLGQYIKRAAESDTESKT